MSISDKTVRTFTRQTESGPESVSFDPQNQEEVKGLPEWTSSIVVKDEMVRTIKCDNPKCDKEVSFSPQNSEQIVALPDWVRTTRSITLGNNQRFIYCSDVCEVEGVTTGNHNVPEPPKVQEATGADMQQAIKAAAQVEKLKIKPTKKK